MLKYTEEEISAANKTARSAGAISRKAVVPRFVIETARDGELVLDYGAGPKAIHAAWLNENCIDCIAYDFGANYVEGLHSRDALCFKYDTVMLSNVLNVQSSMDMLEKTIIEAQSCVRSFGRLVANYPKQPRKLDLTEDQIATLLGAWFHTVVEIKKGLFECYNYDNEGRQERRENGAVRHAIFT